jgi:uncharacterized protein (TIGR02246 family)
MSLFKQRFRRISIVVVCLIACRLAQSVAPVVVASATPEDQIASLVAELQSTWNSGNAQGYSAHFAENGEFTNILGTTKYGKKFFEERHAQIFATFFKGSRLEQKIERIEFIRPDVAIVNLDNNIRDFLAVPPGIKAGPDGVLRTRLLLVLAKEGDAWTIVAYHNVAVMEPPK